MRNIVVFLGKLMAQRSAAIAHLATKDSPSDTELRKLADLQNVIVAVREVLEAKREKSVRPIAAGQPTSAQPKRMIAR